MSGIRERVAGNPKYPRWLLLTTLIGMFSTTFPVTVLSISIKPIAEDLHSVPSTITWVTTAPMLAAAVCTPVLGRLGDLRGHRRMYLAGLLTASFFALMTALAWSAFSLIAFRTLSQLGAAATVPSTFAMLFRSFPPNERVRASSLASGTLAAASVVGVIIGGPLIDLIGWRPIFFMQTAISFIALVPALIVLRPDKPSQERDPIDYLGAVVLGVATFALTFGINRIGVWGPTPVTVGALVVAPLAAWLLIWVERRAAAPLLPLRVLSARNTRVVIATTFLLGLGWMGNFIVTPLLLQSVMGLTAAITSLVTVPRAGSIVLVSPFAGRLGIRFGERKLVVGSCIALSLVMCLLSFAAYTTTLIVVIVALSLSGLAFGNAQPGLLSAMGHAVSEKDFGLATSLQQTSNQIGGVVGIGLFTAIAADSTTPGPFAFVYLITAGIAALAAVISLRMRDSHAGPVHSQAVVDDGFDPAPIESIAAAEQAVRTPTT
ncbi:MAG: putative efflux rane protein [Frankiales bacterium]|nr:putative efflux rane protein [Frankiales bacterium]